jgi:asparagine synthase (glutamine-hydrolysing)
MLFNGEAIFGLVDFSRQQPAARAGAERLSRWAARLGARAEYEEYGSVILGRASRQAQKAAGAAALRDGNFAVAVAGEVVSLAGKPGASSVRDQDHRWIGRGFESEGMRFLHRLDGTFALALWDAQNQRLILATDRRSDAQLFYYRDGEQIFFSSWLGLLAGPDRELDRSSVREFLRFLYVAAPRTIYKAISRVEPGHYVIASYDRLTTHALENPAEWISEQARGATEEQALGRFQQLFENAIERRIGGRRVGVFLSSGVDSATLLAGCQKSHPGQVEAYTVGFEKPELDETRNARAYAEHLGVPHRVLRYDMAQYRRSFATMAREFDQPFADPAGLPLILASDEIKDRVDVISGGTGGDDLFGAPIPRHLWFSLTFSARIPAVLRRPIARIVKQTPVSALSNRASLFDFDDAQELLITWPGWSKSELAELLGEKSSFEDSGFYRLFEKHRRAGAQKLYDALGVFPPDDCRFEAAAPAQIAVELPYHDAELRAFVQSLPPSLRMRDGVSKVLLKELFARYFPPEARPAKKQYFNIPLQKFLADDHFEVVRNYLCPEVVLKHNLVDHDRTRRWIGRYVGGDQSLLFKMWVLVVLHAWVDARPGG